MLGKSMGRSPGESSGSGEEGGGPLGRGAAQVAGDLVEALRLAWGPAEDRAYGPGGWLEGHQRAPRAVPQAADGGQCQGEVPQPRP